MPCVILRLTSISLNVLFANTKCCSHQTSMCDSMDVTDALQRCPFLSRINREKGPSYAGNIATRPAQPADRMGCPFKHTGDALAGLSASFELFHGDRGVLPLHRGSLAQGCPVQHGSQEASAGQHRVAPGSMPVAAISLSGFRFLVSLSEQCAQHLDAWPQRHSNAGQPLASMVV